jgi:hypothetical protein
VAAFEGQALSLALSANDVLVAGGEGARLRFEFESEMARLDAAA